MEIRIVEGGEDKKSENRKVHANSKCEGGTRKRAGYIGKAMCRVRARRLHRGYDSEASDLDGASP
jgi:hypothetical protein